MLMRSKEVIGQWVTFSEFDQYFFFGKTYALSFFRLKTILGLTKRFRQGSTSEIQFEKLFLVMFLLRDQIKLSRSKALDFKRNSKEILMYEFSLFTLFAQLRLCLQL